MHCYKRSVIPPAHRLSPWRCAMASWPGKLVDAIRNICHEAVCWLGLIVIGLVGLVRNALALVGGAALLVALVLGVKAAHPWDWLGHNLSFYTPQQQAAIAASQAASAPSASPPQPALITDQATQRAMTAWAGKLPKACEDLTAAPRITIPRQPGQTPAQIERRLAQSFPAAWLRFLEAQAPNAPWQTGWR
ncbi:MAG TPA: hypothetical protein VI322_04075, partial [Candidatus Saccharimonadia bacterium]